MQRLRPTRALSSLSRQQFAQNLDLLPNFSTSPDRVHILSEPADFHSWLLVGTPLARRTRPKKLTFRTQNRISTAKRRIFLAALYLGKEETAFIEAVHEALRKNPSLEFFYVGDYLRSTREAPGGTCSADLLATLKANFKDRVFPSFYHTPELAGLTKSLVPKRFDEGWGLWHSKVYGFDDDVMISG
jgi:CDP-diacylglycerol--glycerol-3-phosphate 3-phosphatidyltransferase